MPQFANIVYAELNLNFDRNEFINEYDCHVLPNSVPFVTTQKQWYNMKRLNHIWNVIPQDKYDEWEALALSGQSINGLTHQWNMVNFLQVDGVKTDSGTVWKMLYRYTNKILKEQFKNLKITQWIYDNIPAERIVGIHCVSIEPGGFATPHRDKAGIPNQPNPALNNGFYRDGFVVVNLNISSGNSPLLWSLDHEQETNVRSTNADCCMISDYFHHAVPLCTDRRRQIRVSILPTPELATLIKEDTVVTIPSDYQFTN
jgi:hypothetical protein